MSNFQSLISTRPFLTSARAFSNSDRSRKVAVRTPASVSSARMSLTLMRAVLIASSAAASLADRSPAGCDSAFAFPLGFFPAAGAEAGPGAGLGAASTSTSASTTALRGLPPFFFFGLAAEVSPPETVSVRACVPVDEEEEEEEALEELVSTFFLGGLVRAFSRASTRDSLSNRLA